MASTAEEGIKREDTGDDVSQATYTARSYPLEGSNPPDEPPSTLQAGAAEQKRQDSIVPHVPGEFPSEASEEPQEPSAVPEDMLKDSSGIDDVLTTSAVRSTATERTLHPGGSGFPVESSQPQQEAVKAPIEDTKEDEDNAAQNAALATGAGAVGVAGAAGAAGASGVAGVAGVAGAGAVGYGVYEATKDDKQPEQETTTTETAKDNVAPSSAETTEPKAEEAEQPAAPTEEKKDDEDHTARNTALAGAGVAGAGAASYGVYEATKDDQAEPERKKSTMEKLKERFKGDKSKDDKSKDVKAKDDVTKTEEQKPADEKEDEDHTGRNAALAGAGAAGAGAAGYGIYEATKDDKTDEAERLKEQERQREQAERARKEQEKQAEQARKEQEKEAEKARKEQEKKAEKEKKEQEKARKDEEKKAEKERKEREKAAEEEEKKRQKERAAAVAAEEERKKKEDAERQRQEEEERKRQEEEEKRRQAEDDSHLGRDAAIGGAAAVVGGGAIAYAATNDNDEDKTMTEKLHEYESQRDVEPKKDPLEKIKGVFTSDKGDEKTTESETAAAGGSATADRGIAGDQVAPTEGGSHIGGETVVVPGGAAASGAQGTVEVPQERRASLQEQLKDDHPSYENKDLTPAERLHEYEKVRAERGLYDHAAEKKPGLIHRILHPGESRRKSVEPTSPTSSQRKTSSGQHIGTDGPIGDPNQVSGQQQSKQSMEKQPEPATTMRRGSAPPPQEHEGYITLVNPAAGPDAPHVIIRDHPEDTKG